MRNLVLFSIFIMFFSENLYSKNRFSKILYYNNTFGHIHQNPSRYSTSLTVVSCGHPLKVLTRAESKKKNINSRWTYVGAGPYKGYILSKYLQIKSVKCFSDTHSKFFENMNLSITDMYYFGRLYDQYIIKTTRRP